MFAAAQQQHPHHHHYHQQQQQQQQQPQQQQQRPAAGGGGGGGATAPPAASSAEEEALKRNTDCVYFLASPLTCKKGSECEYRHSEYARVNPRDCYFWLNGNCLNPKCGFRHPPLDGLLGTQVAASAGSALPPSVTTPAPAPAPAPATHTPYNPSKQAVPCIFFQKGLCLKGDRCAFSHGLSPLNSKVPKPIAPTPATEAPSQKKAFGGLQKSAQEQKIQQANSLKVVPATAEAKPAPKPESIQPRNSTVERNALLPKTLDDEVPRYKTTVAPVSNGNSSRSSRAYHAIVADDTVFQNGKDADEFLRESSPGFDVLVDDESGDADFYHGEDQYGRTRVHDEGNLNSMEDYDIGHSADYSSMADFDQETYHDPRGYDLQGQYGWDQHRASSEGMPVGPEHGERRGYSKGDNPERIDESDLRHRLSKHRRVNGLRSVVSQDFVTDNHFEERGYHSSSQRDSHHSSSRDIGSRLRGRIKLPDCSPNKGSDYQTERETDRARNRARLSPGRTQVASHSGGRLRNRLKPRVDEEDNNDGRNFRGTWMRNVDDRSNDFAGPKSLAELKVSKNVEGRVQQSLGKRKHHEDHHQPSEGDLSFEGPMPLSEILKRKRGAEAAASGGRTSPLNKDGNNLKDNKETLNGLNDNTETAKVEANSQVLPDKDESSSAIAIKDSCNQSSEQPELVEPEADGLNLDGAMEGQEYEGEYQGDEEYEYEQGEEGEYYEEGENPEGEEEYVEEEEDGEEFCQENGDGAVMSGEDNLLE